MKKYKYIILVYTKRCGGKIARRRRTDDISKINIIVRHERKILSSEETYIEVNGIDYFDFANIYLS